MPLIKQPDGNGHSITYTDTDGYLAATFGLHAELLNTHVPYKYMPREVKELGCKIVHLLQNPKDLAVSLYNHTLGIHLFEYHGKWEHFLPLFLQGKTECNSWFDYVLSWEQVISDNPGFPIHLIYFEDLKQNTLHELYRLGQFLSIEDQDGLFGDIAKKYQFSNMVRDKQQHNGTESEFIRDGFSFFREGEIGDWKNWFTVKQSETFDKIYKDKMSGTKRKFIYDYGTATL